MREFYTWFTCGRDLFLSFYPQPTGAKVGTSNGEDGADDREDWGADQKETLSALIDYPWNQLAPTDSTLQTWRGNESPKKMLALAATKEQIVFNSHCFWKDTWVAGRKVSFRYRWILILTGINSASSTLTKNSWWGKLGFNWWENGRCVGLFGFIQCRFFSVLDGWFYEILLAT